jgi:hypothetical protein
MGKPGPVKDFLIEPMVASLRLGVPAGKAGVERSIAGEDKGFRAEKKGMPFSVGGRGKKS